MAPYFQTGGSVGEPTWHRLEKIRLDVEWAQGIADPVTQAYLMAGIEQVEYLKAPTYYQSPFTGEMIQMEDRATIVRRAIPDLEDMAQETAFETVGSTYELVHPMQIAGALDQVSIARNWGLESWGIVGPQGERLFTALNMGYFDPLGDQAERHLTYLTMIQNMTGKAGIHLTVGTLRAECWNKTEWIMNNQSLISISHKAGAFDTMSLKLNLIAAAENRAQIDQLLVEAMMQTPVTQEQMDRVIDVTYPLPPEDTPDRIKQELRDHEAGYTSGRISADLLEKARKRAAQAETIYWNAKSRLETRRTLAYVRFAEFEKDRPTYAGTIHALYNAITEVADHRPGKGQIADQILFGGERLTEKRNAVTEIDEIMGGRLSAIQKVPA